MDSIRNLIQIRMRMIVKNETLMKEGAPAH